MYRQMITLNNSGSGLKLPRTSAWFSILTDVPRDALEPFFSHSLRSELSFSFTFPPEVLLRSIRTSPRLPVLARVKQRGAHPREFHEIQKKTANPFSPLLSAPFRSCRSWSLQRWYHRLVLRQKPIRSQVKIVTTWWKSIKDLWSIARVSHRLQFPSLSLSLSLLPPSPAESFCFLLLIFFRH